MEFLNKDGLALAYEDTKEDLPPMLLVHGCGCDHRSLIAQAEFFRTSHRVVSVDLRGHGESDAPQQDYTMTTFANDLVSLCNKLSLKNQSWWDIAWEETSYWNWQLAFPRSLPLL
jgi:pimeloyl-ACP methyl ester carboxylesterase